MPSSSAIIRWSWRRVSSSPYLWCSVTCSPTFCTRWLIRAFAMTDHDRSALGDPESGQPPLVAPITGPDTSLAPPVEVAHAGTGARIASALLPGAGHIVMG